MSVAAGGKSKLLCLAKEPKAEERKEERKARPPRWQLRGVSVL